MFANVRERYMNNFSNKIYIVFKNNIYIHNIQLVTKIHIQIKYVLLCLI